MVHRVGWVDAVDFSQGMIEKGRGLPNGDHPNLNWIHGSVETAELYPPYDLVTAGDSLGWMDWSTVFRRFEEVLSPGGHLAIVTRDWGTGSPEELRIFQRFSINKDFRPTNLIEELETRGLFERLGDAWFGPIPFRPTVQEYIGSRHSQQGFSRAGMGSEEADRFDGKVRTLLKRLFGPARIEAEMSAQVIWGRPGTGS